MSPETIFLIHLVLGYAAWLPCFGVYVLPRLEAIDRFEANRTLDCRALLAIPTEPALKRVGAPHDGPTVTG